jgi:hypothetical protein
MSIDRPAVQEALCAVMGAVRSISKDRRVTEGPARFSFRGVDDVMEAVGPALREHGVVFAPSRVVSLDHERYTTARGSLMDGVTIVVEYTVTGPNGDTMTVAAAGQAADSGDKAVPKAMSVAYRTALLEALCIPTGEPDPDASVHERAADVDEAPQLAQPGQLRARIAKLGSAKGKSNDEVAADFAVWSVGTTIAEAGVELLADYINSVNAGEALT